MFINRINEVSKLISECAYATKEIKVSSKDALNLAHAYIEQTKTNKGIVYVIGNGGSAGIASHFCTDLLKALHIPANTLVDSNMLTCIGNDLGYENIYSHPLDIVMKSEDLLVAISSSGKSPNILKAVDVATKKGSRVITLSGFSEDNPLRSKGDLNFWLASHDYGLVETGHFSLLHTLIDTWKDRHTQSNATLLNAMLAYAHKN